MKLVVRRSGRNGKDSRYSSYDVKVSPGMTVLDALFAIRDTEDDSLAFRYSCRGAICGSCTMMINKEPRLACRTQLSSLHYAKTLGLREFAGLRGREDWDRSAEVLVEPLPNMPILKDLVVDMARFFDYYRKVKPWIEALPEEQSSSRIAPSDVSKLERYANCILCGACFGACPVCEKDTTYFGPAALAWSLRMVDDPRTRDRKERLGLVAHRDGVPGCEFVYNCVKVCPKAVAPAGAIRTLTGYIRDEGLTE
jgi:succinate dehydrogenase / fumarate reductase iron-sulfur subunit